MPCSDAGQLRRLGVLHFRASCRRNVGGGAHGINVPGACLSSTSHTRTLTGPPYFPACMFRRWHHFLRMHLPHPPAAQRPGTSRARFSNLVMPMAVAAGRWGWGERSARAGCDRHRYGWRHRTRDTRAHTAKQRALVDAPARRTVQTARSHSGPARQILTPPRHGPCSIRPDPVH